MTRHYVNDVPAPSPDKSFGTVGDVLARSADPTEDPSKANQVSTESLEHAARQLEEAQQTSAAVASWLQAACAHSQRGDHAGVVQSVTHAARLAGHPNFAPFVAKKSTADAAVLEAAEPVERVGDSTDGPTEPPLERDRDWQRPKNSTAAADATDHSAPSERL